MKISIITATYNSAATIRDTLDAIAAQQHPEIEHIIVDGGSTDETMDIIPRPAFSKTNGWSALSKKNDLREKSIGPVFPFWRSGNV